VWKLKQRRLCDRKNILTNLLASSVEAKECVRANGKDQNVSGPNVQQVVGKRPWGPARKGMAIGALMGIAATPGFFLLSGILTPNQGHHDTSVIPFALWLLVPLETIWDWLGLTRTLHMTPGEKSLDGFALLVLVTVVNASLLCICGSIIGWLNGRFTKSGNAHDKVNPRRA
jgi:hypothetical protein